MKHTKRRLVSPMAVGYVSHVLSQRVGLKVFRSCTGTIIQKTVTLPPSRL